MPSNRGDARSEGSVSFDFNAQLGIEGGTPSLQGYTP